MQYLKVFIIAFYSGFAAMYVATVGNINVNFNANL